MTGAETRRLARETAAELKALSYPEFLKRFRDDRTSFTRVAESGTLYEITVEWSDTSDASITVVVTAEDVTQAEPAVESESFVLDRPA